MPRRRHVGPGRRLAMALLGAVFVGALAACDSAVLPTRTAVAPAGEIDATEWVGAICESVDQLALGLGDPETGQRSPAWNAFEVALVTGDEAVIDEAANAVLGHLTQGSRSATVALAFPPGFGAASEWWALLDGLAVGVRTLRDGTNERDAARINEGRALIDQALEAHYEQAVGQLRAVPLVGTTLPCG